MSYTLMIDGADAGQIWSRRTRTFEVSPGMHELEVRFLWIRPDRRLGIGRLWEIRLVTRYTIRTGPRSDRRQCAGTGGTQPKAGAFTTA